MAAICGANPWLDAFMALDQQTLKLRRRDRAPLAARTVQAQYRHWQREFAGNVVLMQVGAFIERLQWPRRRIAKASAATEAKFSGGLRRMRPTRRGALQGFPLAQLDKRVAGLVAADHAVTFVAQSGEGGGGLMPRVPVARWVGQRTGQVPRERPVLLGANGS